MCTAAAAAERNSFRIVFITYDGGWIIHSLNQYARGHHKPNPGHGNDNLLDTAHIPENGSQVRNIFIEAMAGGPQPMRIPDFFKYLVPVNHMLFVV